MKSSRGNAEKLTRLRSVASNRWVHWSILALVMLFTMRGWLNGRLPTSPRMETIPQFTTSWFVLDEMRQGRLLTPWNPWEFGGFPWMRLLAWPLYLSMALISLAGVPMEQALKVLMFAGFVASGVAVYELARLLTGRWQAGLLAGLVYMISPFHIQTAVDWWEYVPFWALFPLPFLFYELSARRPEKRARFLALAALSLGLFAAVSPERTFVSAVCFGAYVVLREAIGIVRRETRLGPSLLRLVLLGGGAGLVTLFMALPMALDLPNLGVSHMRGQDAVVGTALLADYSASPALLLGALLRRVRIPVDATALPTIWKSFGGMFAWYLGWPVLGLAALGLAQARRHSTVWISALLGGLALWLSFGPTVPFNPFQHLPLFSTLMPFRSLTQVLLFLALLAGFGLLTLERWLRRVPLNVWLALAALVVVVDFRPVSDVFGSAESYFTGDEKAAYAFVAEQPGDWRLWEPRGQVGEQYVSSYSLPLAPVERFSGHWVEGTPIHTWEMLDWGDRKTALDVLSVRYVMLRKGDPDYERLRLEAEEAGFALKAWDSPTVEVWEKPDYRPFATLRKAGVLALTADDEWLRVLLPAFVERDVPLVRGHSTRLEDYLGGGTGWYQGILIDGVGVEVLGDIQDARMDGQVTYTRESPTRIRVLASPAFDALLTISEGWYPHWRVYVDGRQAELLRVDYMLQGVLLAAGPHEVVFAYQEPAYAGISLGISALAAAGLIALAVVNPKWKTLTNGVEHAA